MNKDKKTAEEKSIWKDAQELIKKADREGIETVWDRLEKQSPHCNFCELGTTCANCIMGPCRISSKENKNSKMQKGVCGASLDVIVARNFGRFIASGSASHSDHGRDLIEVLEFAAKESSDVYKIKDKDKLERICKELEIYDETLSTNELALKLADLFHSDFSSRKDSISFLKRVPEKRKKIWDNLGVTPRGIDREVVEMMHRTHMGVDNDAPNTLLHAVRCSLADGWGGSMIATEISDIVFGTPSPVMSTANLSVIKEDKVNILVHGHNPVISETILAAAREPAMIAKAIEKGAKGITIGGLCCTGNELLMRQGIPLAGNNLMTELAIVTGAVEAMVVDYQCIMPALTQVASCYHTRFITTSNKAKFTGAIHFDINPANAMSEARKIVELAIEAYTERDPDRVYIPDESMQVMTGFSNEAILAALGGSFKPLIDAIKEGLVRGFVGVVGCNNPKIKHDSANVGIIKALIKKDIMVLVTGCVTSSAGKAGLLVPEAAEKAGPKLKSLCQSLKIPPVLHVGSCVDNSRIIQLAALLANELNVDISQLPLAASAPEWYSEKAAAIGLYAVASGIYTHLGLPPNILGSEMVTDLALNGLDTLLGACFVVEPDPEKAAELIDIRISEKRLALGLSK